MRLLFLDFDGVLNSDAYFASPGFVAVTKEMSDAEVMLLNREYHLDAAKVTLLNGLVEMFDLSVVISSSWRLLARRVERHAGGAGSNVPCCRRDSSGHPA